MAGLCRSSRGPSHASSGCRPGFVYWRLLGSPLLITQSVVRRLTAFGPVTPASQGRRSGEGRPARGQQRDPLWAAQAAQAERYRPRVRAPGTFPAGRPDVRSALTSPGDASWWPGKAGVVQSSRPRPLLPFRVPLCSWLCRGPQVLPYYFIICKKGGSPSESLTTPWGVPVGDGTAS